MPALVDEATVETAEANQKGDESSMSEEDSSNLKMKQDIANLRTSFMKKIDQPIQEGTINDEIPQKSPLISKPSNNSLSAANRDHLNKLMDLINKEKPTEKKDSRK